MVLAIPRLVEVVPRRRAPDPDDPGPLARILSRLRAERGWRQIDVAERAGFEQPYYSSLETGVILRPGKDKLSALETAFELEPGTLDQWLRVGAPFGARGGPAGQGSADRGDAILEWLEMGPDGDITALYRRVPSHRRRQASELIKRQAVEVLKIMAEDDLPPNAS